MFWRDTEHSWWWYRAPIETQAMMIEMFNEISQDKEAVRECQVWLIKQKQTQAWKTTKATADAVYSILLGGDNLLASTKLVEVSLDGKKVEPKNVEAGTGFYQQKFGRGEITSALGQVQMTKHDAGVAWGSVHWQYLEDMSKSPRTLPPRCAWPRRSTFVRTKNRVKCSSRSTAISSRETNSLCAWFCEPTATWNLST